jgi:hypothetical protein
MAPSQHSKTTTPQQMCTQTAATLRGRLAGLRRAPAPNCSTVLSEEPEPVKPQFMVPSASYSSTRGRGRKERGNRL